MDTTLLIARLILAAVFAVAGAAKLADLPGSRQAVGDFGAPGPLAGPLGTLLPLLELTTAGLLLFEDTAVIGGIAALVLLLAFCAGIANVIRKGDDVDCHCFGQLQSSKAGPSTLARNLALAALAGLVAVAGGDDPGPDAFGWVADLDTPGAIATASVLVTALPLGLGAWFATNLLKQQGRVLLRLEALETAMRTGSQLPAPADPNAAGLPIGAPAPDFELPSLDGGTVTLQDLRAPELPVILLFTDPGCGPCNALLPDVGEWQEAHEEELTIALLSRGSAEDNEAKTTEHDLTDVLLQTDREVAEAYDVLPTPSAVLVDTAGRIASHVESGEHNIRALLERALSGEPAAPALGVVQVPANGQPAAPPPPPPTQPIGSDAPKVKLPDLDGENVDLASYRGRDTLVLFWSPGCGFCRQMVPDLNAFLDEAGDDDPRVYVISSGGIDSNRELDVHATVVLDETGQVMQSFGAQGTPMAVRLDAKGKVASDVAGGAPAVLALARGDGVAA